ncbi:MAG: nucleotidyltransferase family protein, partial [Microbacter sp.]
VTINGVALYALDRCHQLIHLCLHLDKHFRGGHVQFTCFMDVANFLDRYGDLMDWDQLIALSKKYHSETQVFKYMLLVQQLMHVSIPAHIAQAYGQTLTQEEVNRFFQLLHGKRGKDSYNGVFNNLKQMPDFSSKVRYALGFLFPSIDFMKKRYGIKQFPLLIWYYLYRLLKGFRVLMNYLFFAG